MLWRNTLAVLAGFGVAAFLIVIGLTFNKLWFEELDYINLAQRETIFIYWRDVLRVAPTAFFVAMLVSGGIASLVGGIVTALLVPRARTAYAMIIGFILFIIAILDIIIFKGHPTWYQIALFFIYFPFSWLGGEIIEYLKKKKVIPQ